MTCQLDHIAIIAPSLEAGRAWVEACLNVTPLVGGRHPQMGTHNELLRLGDDFFLEVIAVDPSAPAPSQARWFGLDDEASLCDHWAAGRRLRGMVARTDDLTACLATAPDQLGTAMELSRGERIWTFGVRADGQLPCGGAGPHVMNWGRQGPAAPAMPERGCRLSALVLETPNVAAAQAFHRRIALDGAPAVRPGAVSRLIAVIDTPAGPKLLT